MSIIAKIRLENKNMTKEKIRIEYILNNISLSILWNSISTPSGLAEWFADDVAVDGKIYTFKWNGATQEAEVLVVRTGYYIRFHWLDDDDPKTYFELKVSPDELTGDVALIITDYVEHEEKEDHIALWNKQIEQLKRKAGIRNPKSI